MIYSEVRGKLLRYREKEDYNKGYCDVFAIVLYERLKKAGYNPKIIEVNKGYHYFVYIENKSIDVNGIYKGLKSPLPIKIGKYHYKEKDATDFKFDSSHKMKIIEEMRDVYEENSRIIND